MKNEGKFAFIVVAIFLGVLVGAGINLTFTNEVQAQESCGTCMPFQYSPYSFCDLVISGGGCDGHHTGAPCGNNCGMGNS